MSDIAIQFDHVGKLYKLGLVGTGTLSHDLNRWWKTSVLHQDDPYLKIGETNDRSKKGSSDYVWALKDISFDVKQGDVVGIIGKNGAGKSTLLKLLSRVTSPTTGAIRARGRIGSLLEVGTGFHPEMTGRENIYMNGSIMGMTKQEITRKLDEIVDFAGVERYLDTPVKRYSSGMTVRLGFAVAAFMEPEILVVDEVLAVGDAEFQKKAIGKMQDVSKGAGRTVLFVSHNMAAVRSLCNNGVLLENGSVKLLGDIETIISYYLRGNSNVPNHHNWISVPPEYSNSGFELLEIGVRRKGEDYTSPILMDAPIELIIKYRLINEFDKFWITLHFKNEMGYKIFSTGAGEQVERKKSPGTYTQVCEIPADFLNWGEYYVSFMCFRDSAKCILNIPDILMFTVNNKVIQLGGWMGKEPGDITPHFLYTENKE